MDLRRLKDTKGCSSSSKAEGLITPVHPICRTFNFTSAAKNGAKGVFFKGLKSLPVITALLICLALLAPPLMAANTDEPVRIVKSKLDEVTAILENEDLQVEQKRAAIIEAVSPVFDLPLMAKLVLGKENWGRFSAEERKEFSDVFIERLKRLYLSKLEMYSGEKVIFKKPTDNGNKVSVPTAVISEGSTLPVIYKLYRGSEGWLAYDVDISGTSVVASHRSEYDAFLKEGTPRQLIDKLKQSD